MRRRMKRIKKICAFLSVTILFLPITLSAQSSGFSVRVSAGGAFFPLSEMKDFIENYKYGEFKRASVDLTWESLLNYEISDKLQIGIGGSFAQSSATFKPYPSSDPDAAIAKWNIEVVGLITRAQYAFPRILGNFSLTVGGGMCYYFPLLRQESNYTVSEDPSIPNLTFPGHKDESSRLVLELDGGAESEISSSLTLFATVTYKYSLKANKLLIGEQRPNFVFLKHDLPLRLSNLGFTIGIAWYI